MERYARTGRRLCNAICLAIAPRDSTELSRYVVADPKKLSESGKDMEKLESLIEALAESYNEAKSPGMRIMVLSLLAPYCKYNKLAELIPTLSPHKFTSANLYAKMYGPGTQPPEVRRTRSYVSKIKLTSFLDFLLSNGISVELPYGEVHVKLSSGATESIPNLLRIMTDEYTADLYIKTLKETGQWDRLGLSRSFLLRILKLLKSSHRQQVRGIDYFHSYGSEGFDTLMDVVTRLEENNLVDKDWSAVTKKRLHELHYFLKADYRGKIRDTSRVADFCSTYALSDPNNRLLSTELSTAPDLKCFECQLLFDTFDDIATTIEKAEYQYDREKAEAQYLVGAAKKDILNWKAHIVRTFRQNLGRQRAMEDLGDNQVIIWLDWAMKWLPERARENQTSFFGKSGLPWHISVAYKRNQHRTGYDVRYFVHSFQSTVQDSAAVVAVINDTLIRIKAECSYITQAILFSDNAGCYKSGNTIATMPRMEADTGIAVVRWDFSDAQSGKGPADRFAATVKRKVRLFIDEGNNCDTSESFVNCMNSHNGIHGMTAIVSQLECKEPNGPASKIKDIKKYHNFLFFGYEIQAHRHFKIGRGAMIAHAPRNSHYLQCYLKPLRVVSREISESVPNRNENFWKSLLDRAATEVERPLEEGTDANADIDLDPETLKNNANLFRCPIPGCSKTYQKYKNLKRHLELMNHDIKAETETQRDFIIREYKDRVERLQMHRFMEMADAIREVGSIESDPPKDSTETGKGWALQSRTVERFSTKVRQFLIEKFDEGVMNPRKKWKPDVLAKAMRNDEQFDASEFLKSQQIAAFFSRLAQQREKQNVVGAAETMDASSVEHDEDYNNEPSEFEHDPARDTFDDVRREVQKELKHN